MGGQYWERKKFTIIELLIVIVILAILISIILPSLGKARDKAKEMTCFNNLKQIGVCVHLYLSEWDGYYPAIDWTRKTQSYLGSENRTSNKLYLCPKAPERVSSGDRKGMEMRQTYDITGDFYTSNLDGVLRFCLYLLPDFRVKDGQVYLPSQKIYLTDHGEYAYLDNTNANDREINKRHFERGSILLADGHVRGQTLPPEVPPLESAQCKPSEDAYVANRNKSTTFY